MVEKSQRLEIYKKLREVYREEFASDCTFVGFCYCLDIVLGRMLKFHEITEFPELMAYKPANQGPDDFWWPWNDYDTRINVLNEVINKMEYEQE